MPAERADADARVPVPGRASELVLPGGEAGEPGRGVSPSILDRREDTVRPMR